LGSKGYERFSLTSWCSRRGEAAKRGGSNPAIVLTKKNQKRGKLTAQKVIPGVCSGECGVGGPGESKGYPTSAFWGREKE